MEHSGQGTMDPEALERSGRRRRGCLDAFLVSSVIFLFLAVTALGAGGLVAVLDLRTQVGHSRPSFLSKRTGSSGDTPIPAYKMQNFAFLEATEGKLLNYTMSWDPVTYLEGKTVGSNFDFDRSQMSLTPRREGTYFIYMDLKLSCTSVCRAGVVTVKLGSKLTCSVELRADATHASNKCWTVVQMDDKTGLVAVMTAPKELQNWKLEHNDSHLGMFLVD